jgi:tRNA pseudouridine synthase D (truD)
VGKNKGNLFEIRLRKRSALDNGQIQALEEKIEEIKKSGFPNAF